MHTRGVKSVFGLSKAFVKIESSHKSDFFLRKDLFYFMCEHYVLSYHLISVTWFISRHFECCEAGRLDPAPDNYNRENKNGKNVLCEDIFLYIFWKFIWKIILIIFSSIFLLGNFFARHFCWTLFVGHYLLDVFCWTFLWEAFYLEIFWCTSLVCHLLWSISLTGEKNIFAGHVFWTFFDRHFSSAFSVADFLLVICWFFGEGGGHLLSEICCLTCSGSGQKRPAPDPQHRQY